MYSYTSSFSKQNRGHFHDPLCLEAESWMEESHSVFIIISTSNNRNPVGVSQKSYEQENFNWAPSIKARSDATILSIPEYPEFIYEYLFPNSSNVAFQYKTTLQQLCCPVPANIKNLCSSLWFKTNGNPNDSSVMCVKYHPAIPFTVDRNVN